MSDDEKSEEGYNCHASGPGAHAVGYATIASGMGANTRGIGTLAFGAGSSAGGRSAVANDHMQNAWSSGHFQEKGDAQLSYYHVMGETNGKESTNLCLDYPICERFPTARPGQAWIAELDLVAADKTGLFCQRSIFGLWRPPRGSVNIETRFEEGEVIAKIERGTLIGSFVGLDMEASSLIVTVCSPSPHTVRWSGKLNIVQVTIRSEIGSETCDEDDVEDVKSEDHP